MPHTKNIKENEREISLKKFVTISTLKKSEEKKNEMQHTACKRLESYKNFELKKEKGMNVILLPIFRHKNLLSLCIVFMPI